MNFKVVFDLSYSENRDVSLGAILFSKTSWSLFSGCVGMYVKEYLGANVGRGLTAILSFVIS